MVQVQHDLALFLRRHSFRISTHDDVLLLLRFGFAFSLSLFQENDGGGGGSTRMIE
jgi:hypothetical protein